MNWTSTAWPKTMDNHTLDPARAWTATDLHTHYLNRVLRHVASHIGEGGV